MTLRTNTRNILAIAGMVSMSLLVGAKSHVEWTPAAAELRATLALLGPPPVTCPTQCEYSCFDLDEHQNKAHTNGTNSGTTHNCEFGELGCEAHKCDGFADASVDLQRLETVIRQVDGKHLKLLAKADGRLRINWARRAVQLMSCNNQVALSLSLSDEQAAALEE